MNDRPFYKRNIVYMYSLSKDIFLGSEDLVQKLKNLEVRTNLTRYGLGCLMSPYRFNALSSLQTFGQNLEQKEI